MGKIKKKPKKNVKQKDFKLAGIISIAIGITIAYSAFYVMIGSGDNMGDTKKVFQQSSTTLLNHCAGVCSLSAKKAGDVVISYNGDIMVSGAGQWGGNNFPKIKNKNVNIPAGKYTVKLESYDNFVGREDNPVSEQSQEKYYVILKNGNNELARTGITNDLEDGVEEAEKITFVNRNDNPITLGNNVNKITVVHAGPSNQLMKHGFEPVCMLLEKIEATPVCGDNVKNGSEQCDNGNQNGVVPSVDYGQTKTYCKSDCTNGTVKGGQCGNAKKEGDEQCDDGNTTNGDGCSSTCQIEVVPSCGDGHKDSGEQCDDGNTTSGDGCSSSCMKEEVEEIAEDDDCDASIGNYIWYDANGNGVQEDIEEGIEGIKVCAYNGNKKYCDITNSKGRYKIKDLCSHTYSVRVLGADNLTQTYDPDGRKDNRTNVKLRDGDNHTKADFGYRGSAPSTGMTTNIALLIGLSTLITIGVLVVIKKKGII